MDEFDDAIFQCLVSCLTTREYIAILRLSKSTRQKALKYKKLRQPCIFAIGWSDHKEIHYPLNQRFQYPKEFRTRVNETYPELFTKYEDKVNKKKYLSRDKKLIQMILKYPQDFMASERHVSLFSVPHMFRNAVNLKRAMRVSPKKYLKQKMEKYMLRNATDSVLFQRLRQKYNFAKEYDKHLDLYMFELDSDLDIMLNGED